MAEIKSKKFLYLMFITYTKLFDSNNCIQYPYLMVEEEINTFV